MTHAMAIVALDGDEVDGLGDREGIEEAVAHQMEPFNEREEWFRDGSRWDWWVIGGRYDGGILDRNVVRRETVDADALARWNYEEAKRSYQRWVEDDLPEALLPIDLDEVTMEEYAQQQGDNKIVAYTFVKDRTWHEKARLGWWGATAKTECDLDHDHDNGDFNICKFEDDETGGAILSHDDGEDWNEKYWKRFIEPLDPETILVVVDYHV